MAELTELRWQLYSTEINVSYIPHSRPVIFVALKVLYSDLNQALIEHVHTRSDIR